MLANGALRLMQDTVAMSLDVTPQLLRQSPHAKRRALQRTVFLLGNQALGSQSYVHIFCSILGSRKKCELSNTLLI